MFHCFSTANSAIGPLKFWWVRRISFNIVCIRYSHSAAMRKTVHETIQFRFRKQLISDVVVSDIPSKSEWKVLIKDLLKSRTKGKIDVGSKI